jgi:3-methyladenine DNA glycosylase AlkD
MPSLLKNFRLDLHALADPDKAIILQRFFKTGKGEYGEGDKFLGIKVPEQRNLIKRYLDLNFADLQSMLKSKFHEERLSAILILVTNYKKTKDALFQQKIYEFYFANSHGINNWDFVDLSAPYIAGHYLFVNKGERKILDSLVRRENLWERRIAMLATFYFIREGVFAPTFKLAKQLLHDKEDLMHKATGWMLREIGKRDFAAAEKFLKQHYQEMPRTMLRYAIEKFPEDLRLEYLMRNV